MREVVILSAVRTPVGRGIKGNLKDTRPEDLAALVLKEAAVRAGVKLEDVNDVVLGCAFPEGEQGWNIGRNAALYAGFPYTTTGITVNRFCSSGLQAQALAVTEIASGWFDVAIAGGVESMSMVPMMGNKPTLNAAFVAAMPEAFTPMGLTAELVAKRFEVTRAQQDEFAYNSHMKAAAAQAAGKFKEELVPVKTKVFAGTENGRPVVKDVVVDADECPRGDTTIEKLATLKPAFDPKGSVTAGNSSPMSDGAAAVLFATADYAKAHGLKPLAKLTHFSVAGTPPDIMGIGPVPAVRKLLDQTGLKLSDIDLFEVNEAFAAQAVYVGRELGLPADRTNVNGGAIALGHPLGGTGAKLTATLLNEMKRRQAKRGVVTMCIGGGMGAAGLFELL